MPTTPVQSPKIPKVVRMETPSTPPSLRKLKRLSGAYLKTPEQVEIMPFSPSKKRTSSIYNKSPDYKLNSHNVQSPYNAMNLLKTPRHLSYDEEGAIKSQKTPQYFSPGKRLFTEEVASKEELSEISIQLKSKLSNALGKIQQSKSSVSSSMILNDLSMQSTPTYQRANFNLQTLQQSPISTQPLIVEPSPLPVSPTLLSNSPPLERTIIGANEETSAHNALMAALSRQQKRRSRSSFSSPTKPLVPTSMSTTASVSASTPVPKLAPINMSVNTEVKPLAKADTEQDAVLSLMSLSSPQSVKFTHSRTHSLNTNGSPVSSRASSVASPSGPSGPILLPPISGIMGANNNFNLSNNKDDDETDVENDETDDDNDNE